MDRKIEKKRFTPKKITIYTLSGIFVLFVLYNFIFGDASKKLNVDLERITISTVQKGLFQEFTPITGTVQPIETFQLDVSDGGRVMKKYVEEGAFLNTGDPIILLDNAQLRLSIIYNEANVFQQINNLRSTRLSFQQNKLDLRARLYLLIGISVKQKEFMKQILNYMRKVLFLKMSIWIQRINTNTF